ncbi:MAG: cellobiose phosphorylase [Tenericutes bacterium HGW-Tenericutes-6]|nr:MAG: cellobiose phosphorylase [Tenericutes bacterium HGW-Tenericutes-6]
MIKKETFQKNKGYYFPLFNLKGLRSAITPYFGGDLKLDQHHYALEPTTEVDLYNNISSRNVIFSVDGVLYFLNGQTERQLHDDVTYETGLLYQKVIRHNKHHRIETVSYIPLDQTVELHEIEYTNITKNDQTIIVKTAVPIYGRSADNLRDHRHVTSLLNRIYTHDFGVYTHPTLSFDERGHQQNDTFYSVFAKSNHLKIEGFIPVLDDFINGGSLHFPLGEKLISANQRIDGYEAIGGIQFKKITLKPNQSISFILSIGIHKNEKDMFEGLSYLDEKAFHKGLEDVQSFFESYLSGLSFKFHDEKTSDQLKWVTLQPMLRRYFGNSYLPHHDYGHGGRGWRDLWQDLLALIMMQDDTVFDLLYNNFLGIRIDGSNATIIGDAIGEFKADRNMITRVWSDHGAWPLLTTKLYMDVTGDLNFLLKKQAYFMDQFTHYTKQTRPKTNQNRQIDEHGQVYEGTILEHLLLQNLVGHHHIGAHGFVRLEDADWNDGLDMAHDLGETIAFTHMYASNLKVLANLINALDVESLEFFESLHKLFDLKPALNIFFDEVKDFKGKKKGIAKEKLVLALQDLYEKRIKHLHQNGFKENRYQSYFDNDGKDVDSSSTMNLTGQAIALLSETPTVEQAVLMASTTRNMLFDASLGGYKLNSNYQKVLTNMGRAYGFAYGHKENGATFSHMAVMYAYGLYQYDLVSYGHEAMMALLKKAQDPSSKVWAGIPEYFNDRGIGMYPYLTGSASWMLLLMRNLVFGIKFDLGKLFFEPKLKREDFIDGIAVINTYLFDRLTKVTYHNPKGLDYGFYSISKIIMNGKTIKQGITSIDGDIEVYLDEVL